jgi:methylmalonyl-CoA/ethylmalonyl-CoA epimerase
MSGAAPRFGLSSIGQIAVQVRDTARATAFYRDRLGMKLLFSAGAMAFFDAGGVRLMLSTPEKPEFDHPSSIIYFRVADLALAHDALRGRGVKFREEPHLLARMPDHELWMAFFEDSEGNVMALMSEIRK